MTGFRERKQYRLMELDRGYWIKMSIQIRDEVKATVSERDVISIVFDKSIDKLESFHVVLLSCIIEDLKAKSYLIRLIPENEILNKFINDDISISSYWRSEEKKDHVDSKSKEILNLWRVTSEGKEGYSISVEKYFKSLFPERDMSMLGTLLNELFFNIFDHAEAGGNAFSYISYKKEEDKIHIAVCDYGKGIAKTLGYKFKDQKDSFVLAKSIESGVTSGSQAYNKGFGLDTVVSFLTVGNSFRMISNKGLIKVDGENKRCEKYDIKFDFRGTLIYFDISIASFDEEEECGSFLL